MKTTAIVIAAALGILGAGLTAAPASAQSSVSATAMVGRPLVNANGETLGQIQTVLVDDGNVVRHVIVVVGDGIGTSRRVALDPSRITPQGDRYLLNATREDLRLLPGYDFAAPAGVVYIDKGQRVPEYGTIMARPIFAIEEARARIEAEGYSAVFGLIQDDELAWSAIARAGDGRAVRVTLDSKGVLTAR
jgi:hypothetical protein